MKSVKMSFLGKACYASVQRALKSIWYGEASPLAEAAEWAAREQGPTEYSSVDDLREQTELALAEYAGLIVAALPISAVPAQVNQLAACHTRRIEDRLLQAIREQREMAKGIPVLREELQRLRNEIEAAQKPVREAAARVKNLKQRNKALETQEAHLKERNRVLLASVNALDASITALMPAEAF